MLKYIRSPEEKNETHPSPTFSEYSFTCVIPRKGTGFICEQRCADKKGQKIEEGTKSCFQARLFLHYSYLDGCKDPPEVKCHTII